MAFIARSVRDIAPGQRFRKAGAGGTWEVVSVATDPGGALHIRLRSLEEPKTFRTLAAEVLLDRSRFEHLPTL